MKQTLMITSVEYTTPRDTRWALWYTQSINVSIARRNGAASTGVLTATYGNRRTYADAGDALDVTGEYVGPGAHTYVASFPVGPLMGPTARLCVSAGNTNHYWQDGGWVRVRGRLVSAGSGSVQVPPIGDPAQP